MHLRLVCLSNRLLWMSQHRLPRTTCRRRRQWPISKDSTSTQMHMHVLSSYTTCISGIENKHTCFFLHKTTKQTNRQTNIINSALHKQTNKQINITSKVEEPAATAIEDVAVPILRLFQMVAVPILHLFQRIARALGLCAC